MVLDLFAPSTPMACRARSLCLRPPTGSWLAAKELNLSYHDLDAILDTVYPHYGNWVAVKELKLSYPDSDTILFTIYPR